MGGRESSLRQQQEEALARHTADLRYMTATLRAQAARCRQRAERARLEGTAKPEHADLFARNAATELQAERECLELALRTDAIVARADFSARLSEVAAVLSATSDALASIARNLHAPPQLQAMSQLATALDSIDAGGSYLKGAVDAATPVDARVVDEELQRMHDHAALAFEQAAPRLAHQQHLLLPPSPTTPRPDSPLLAQPELDERLARL